jgi:WD40 repeat protein
MHPIHSIELPSPPITLAITKTHLLTTTISSTLHFTDITTFQSVDIQTAKANTAILHPKAKLCIVALQKPQIQIKHIETQKTLARFNLTNDGDNSTEPTALAFSTDSNCVFAAGDKGGSVNIFDTRIESKNAKLRTYREIHEDEITHITAHNQLLFSLAQDGRMAVMDIRARKPLQVSDQQDYELAAAISIKHGKKMATTDQQGTIALWNWGKWGDLSDRVPNLHPESVDTIAKLNEDTVVTGCLDGNIRSDKIL